ncbi:MAG: hypothetical protein K2W95_04430 [Candidatus Obscuribacterales bacterium]|nr:hypothetical protein [Candidatus Obscuribacterales bacterium]
MMGKTCKILLLALAMQLSTAAAFAVTGVDACLRPDGGGEAGDISAAGEDDQSADGSGTVVYATPESGAGDAFDTVMADMED